MEEDKKVHTHNFYKITEVEEHFTNIIKENKKYIQLLEGVDLGAGGGRFSKILGTYAKTVYAVDISNESIAAMKINLAELKNVKIIKIPENKLPFDDSSMDFVFAANSFHDVPVGYEKEINRVLKAGGNFIDLDWKKEKTEFGPPIKIRFSEEDVIQKMEKQNFKLIKKIDIKTHYMLIFSKI
ncbi:MAG: class I SAM-dependent methyltransferase [Candidatus Marsarchaeota archaeon]|nr:class I SAM-dependent methyltransferase [Candidatus Marsarchaeota archaeon]